MVQEGHARKQEPVCHKTKKGRSHHLNRVGRGKGEMNNGVFIIPISRKLFRYFIST